MLLLAWLSAKGVATRFLGWLSSALVVLFAFSMALDSEQESCLLSHLFSALFPFCLLHGVSFYD
eukprot:m.236808 g.236808  ORF g.236808 m.236808 type:complete len:64 (-) comp10901_c1_seq6:147-338(-)